MVGGYQHIGGTSCLHLEAAVFSQSHNEDYKMNLYQFDVCMTVHH